MSDDAGVVEQEVLGICSFEVPRTGLVHKHWFSWPPPSHLAVARIKPPGRQVAIAAVDATAWSTDQALIPHADVVWIYDQVSISDADTDRTPDGDPTSPQLPAAFYRRREGRTTDYTFRPGGTS